MIRKQFFVALWNVSMKSMNHPVFMASVLAVGGIIAIASAALAQTPPEANLQSIGLDRQGSLAMAMHNDQNLAALIAEIVTLRAENKRLNDELAKAT
jgi:hypothetical protein